MKKLLSILLCFALISGATAQTIKQDANGNFIQVAKVKQPDKATGKTFTDLKGKKYPVYQSEKGKLYIIRTAAKSGNIYRQYLN